MDRPEDDAPSVLSPFTKPDPEHTPVFNRKAFVKFPLADELAASTGAPTSTGTKSSSSRRSKATAPAVTPLVNVAEEAAPKAERKVVGASTMGDKKRPLGGVAAIVALGIWGAQSKGTK